MAMALAWAGLVTIFLLFPEWSVLCLNSCITVPIFCEAHDCFAFVIFESSHKKSNF
jgi:hypothetical protein